MANGTIFSANDKSISDALNQKAVTNANLRDLFLSRGMIISKESSRKSLASHFSRLSHDFYDYELLAAIFGGTVHRERHSSTRITTETPLTTFEAAAHELKSDLEKIGAAVKVYTAKGTRLDIEIKYQALQFNKSEFRQIVNKTATITIRKDGGDLIFSAPHNDDTSEWISALAIKAREKTGEDLQFSDIELPPGLRAIEKSRFFIDLIHALDGYQPVDVTDAYVSHPRPENEEEEDEDAGDIGIHISKASLKGQGVLHSEELKLLQDKGFYISKIIWTARGHTSDSDLYEFEAQFSLPDSCAEFTYLPRGFYRNLDGMGFAQSRTGLPGVEEYRFGQLIESAARATLDKLFGDRNA